LSPLRIVAIALLAGMTSAIVVSCTTRDEPVRADTRPDGQCIEPRDSSAPDGSRDARVAADSHSLHDGARDRGIDGTADAWMTDLAFDQQMGPRCPACMVLVNGEFCIDRYEASRPDATREHAGVTDGAAQCKALVMPWWTRTLGLGEAAAACRRAGKRLCRQGEWMQACKGPQQTVYSYGDDYHPTRCNGIDRFCHCGAGSRCDGVSPCPYAHCFNEGPPSAPEQGACGADPHAVATGSHPDCVNDWGLYDFNGNVWEVVEGGDGQNHFRGGAYNCIDSERLHRCDFDITSGVLARGFRCCADPAPQ
jgi:sulfatase modifying factor 1